MVKYLVNLYGIEDLRSMLQALSEGNTEDEALMAAYGIDAFTLENQWREFLEDDLAAAEDENRLAGAPVQTAGPSDDPDPQLAAGGCRRGCRNNPRRHIDWQPRTASRRRRNAGVHSNYRSDRDRTFRAHRLPGLPPLFVAAGVGGRDDRQPAAVCIGPARSRRR